LLLQLGTVDLLFPVDVTPRNGFELVHGFSYEFRNIQCLQYSATQNSCSLIHHQIISISHHSHNTTTPHSFHLSRIICYFLYSFPGAHGTQAQHPLETYKTHGQCSQNISINYRSLSFTTPIPHSFHLSRIICYFLHSSPGAYGLQAQFPWRHTRPMVNILKITQWMTDHSKTTWRPSQNNSTIPRITLWMTDQSHSTWNTSHMAQMTQKVTIIYRIFARDTRHRTVIYVYISQESL
jgi:hypothetical protein